MLFNTLPFLGFFCVVFAVYWVLPFRRGRLIWLLAASVYFYMSWNPWLISLIIFSASVDYFAALFMERIESTWKRRTLLIVSISTNLGLLAYFKYVNFFLSSAYAVQGWFGEPMAPRVLDVVLPLGISFYTFETISYIVDVYCRRTRTVRDPLEYAIYILFFPHLVAGPIVRPRDFLPQLRRRHYFSWDRMQLGLQFFLIGLFKKAALADNLVPIIDPVFASPGDYATSATWVAVLAYSAQIYLDFSGYSDMAVGLAHMLGYRLPANFNMPYLATNLADFWRRWHISLSSWLRDYLFIPMGGSHGTTFQTCRNLMLTMLLGGLWHGANWTFIAWGAWHGFWLVVHRLLPEATWRRSAAWKPLAILATFGIVCIGWIFFRAQTFTDAGTILSHLSWPTTGELLTASQYARFAFVLAALIIGHLLGTLGNLRDRERVMPELAIGGAMTVLLLLVLLLAPENGNAFIYFQF